MRCNNINENMYVEYLTYTSGLATGGKIQGIIYTEDIQKTIMENQSLLSTGN